jgi:hypothetical protein
MTACIVRGLSAPAMGCDPGIKYSDSHYQLWQMVELSQRHVRSNPVNTAFVLYRSGDLRSY